MENKFVRKKEGRERRGGKREEKCDVCSSMGTKTETRSTIFHPHFKFG